MNMCVGPGGPRSPLAHRFVTTKIFLRHLQIMDELQSLQAQLQRLHGELTAANKHQMLFKVSSIPTGWSSD